MGDAARVLGMGPDVEYKGKKYALAEMCMELRGAFEMWLEDRAWKAVLRSRQMVPPEEYQAGLKGVAHDIAAGVYSFYEDAAETARQTIPGHAHWLYLRLKLANKEADEITEEFVKEMMEAKGEEILQTMLLKDLDPKEEAPAGSDSAISN